MNAAVAMHELRIRKALRVQGRTLAFRNATVADAAFVRDLRCDARKSRHLSSTSDRLDAQVAWLEGYESYGGQAYFIIEAQSGDPLGTVRLYDARGESFCWGSWILRDGAPPAAAIESALMVYAYALDTLGFASAHFQVRRDNTSVRAFHERFGAIVRNEDETEFDYALGGEAIRRSMQRYSRFLPDGVTLEGLQ